MKATRFLSLAMGLAVVSTATTAAETWVPGDTDLVVIEGRAVVSPEEHATSMGFPGVTAHLRTNGTGLVLHYTAPSEKVMIDVRVGEGEFVRHHLQQGDHALTLFSDMPAAPRAVELVKRTEGWQGLLTIRGWAVEEGRLIEPDSRPERRLLFISDSITAGAATDFREGDADDGFSASNGRYSYGYQLARMLDAQVHLVGFGGKGLVRDWQGLRSEITAPEYYEQALPTQTDPRWDHAAWLPDAVFVCLGTNDFNQVFPTSRIG